MTDNLDKEPRNFFAEWNEREQIKQTETTSFLGALKDVSSFGFAKNLASKRGPGARG